MKYKVGDCFVSVGIKMLPQVYNLKIDRIYWDSNYPYHAVAASGEDKGYYTEDFLDKNYILISIVQGGGAGGENITTFKTGSIRDSQEGKADYIETIPWIAMERYAQYMTGKKSRYGAGNFKKGIDIESYEKSLVRHLQKYLANKFEGGTVEKNDDHLCAMMFNILGIIYEEERAKLK